MSNMNRFLNCFKEFGGTATVEELSEKLGLSEKQVYQLAAQSKIRHNSDIKKVISFSMTTFDNVHYDSNIRADLEEIINATKTDEYTSDELAKIFGRSTTTIRLYLRELAEAGKVHREKLERTYYYSAKRD